MLIAKDAANTETMNIFIEKKFVLYTWTAVSLEWRSNSRHRDSIEANALSENWGNSIPLKIVSQQKRACKKEKKRAREREESIYYPNRSRWLWNGSRANGVLGGTDEKSNSFSKKEINKRSRGSEMSSGVLLNDWFEGLIADLCCGRGEPDITSSIIQKKWREKKKRWIIATASEKVQTIWNHDQQMPTK